MDGWLGTYAKLAWTSVARAPSVSPQARAKHNDPTLRRRRQPPNTCAQPVAWRSRSNAASMMTRAALSEVAYRAIRHNTLALFDRPMTRRPPPRLTWRACIWQQNDKLDRNDAARPWQSFDALKAGDVIGTCANGEVNAPARWLHRVSETPRPTTSGSSAEATGRFNLVDRQLFHTLPTT